MSPPPLPDGPEDTRGIARLNRWLAGQDASARITWALEHAPGTHVLSSSFGAQAAAMLHLATTQVPQMPVVLVDTGYLFPETYRFADTLTERLGLNLMVYRPRLGGAWAEARYGRLWEQGVAGLDRYNYLHKVEPMRRALAELGAGTWLAGLRRRQARTRETIRFFDWHEGRWKLHPIADWSDRDIGLYLKEHDLPWHPLWEQGYVSIGDVHTTRPLGAGMDVEDTRFFGLKRECGLHFGAAANHDAGDGAPAEAGKSGR